MSRVYPAVKAIIQQENKFLLVKQQLPNCVVWDLPGGRVDYGESPYDTLVREVKEETHLSVTLVKPLGFFWFFRKTDNNQVVCTTFLCTANSNVDITKNPTNEQITDYKRVTKEEFLTDQYTVSHDSLKELVASTLFI